MLLLLLACTGGPDPTDPASPSGRLAAHTGRIGREARALSIEITELDELFDQIRTAPPEERDALANEIRRRTGVIRQKAEDLRGDVDDLEAAAQVY